MAPVNDLLDQVMTSLGRSGHPLDSAAIDRLIDSAIADADIAPLTTISEVAALTRTTPSTIRYYESEGLLAVPRDELNRRVFDIDAIKQLVFLTWMRLSGMSMRRLKEYAALTAAGPQTVAARLQIMEEHRADLRRRIADLEFALAVTTYKIDRYGGACGPDTMDELLPAADSDARTSADGGAS